MYIYHTCCAQEDGTSAQQTNAKRTFPSTANSSCSLLQPMDLIRVPLNKSALATKTTRFGETSRHVGDFLATNFCIWRFFKNTFLRCQQM